MVSTTLVGASGGRGGNFYVTATNAAGPWSDPVWLDKEGIDPSLFFDASGQPHRTAHPLGPQERESARLESA